MSGFDPLVEAQEAIKHAVNGKEGAAELKLSEFEPLLIKLVNKSKESQALGAADLLKHRPGNATSTGCGFGIENSATQT